MITRALILVAVLAAPAAAAPWRSVVDGFTGFCGIDGAGKIWCTESNELPAVEMTARDILVEYNPLVVRDDGTLVRVETYPKKLEPISVAFPIRRARYIGPADDKTLCVYGEKGELACGKIDKGKLVATPAKMRFTSIAFGTRSVWLLDERGGLWCQGGDNCARLRYAAKRVPPKTALLDPAMQDAYPNALDKVPDSDLWQVTDGVARVYPGGSVCIERTKDPSTVTCWDWVDGPIVYPRPKADETVVVGVHLCTRARDTITCTFLMSDGADNPAYAGKKAVTNTFTVKGATRMHAAETKLCIEDAKAALVCTTVAGNDKFPALAPVVWEARVPETD